jgi:hypothetical protein
MTGHGLAGMTQQNSGSFNALALLDLFGPAVSYSSDRPFRWVFNDSIRC